jgi:hypothetical protein
MPKWYSLPDEMSKPSWMALPSDRLSLDPGADLKIPGLSELLRRPESRLTGRFLESPLRHLSLLEFERHASRRKFNLRAASISTGETTH